MTGQEMVRRVRILLPGAKKTVVSDSDLLSLLNEGVNQVNLRAQVYKGYFEFSTTVDKYIYTISELTSDFLGMAKGGVWYTDSDGKLTELYPKTKEWLDKNKTNWRDNSSGEPQYYWQDGDELGFNPPPAYTRTVRVYYLKKATPMGTGTYPWKGTTTEITALSPLDNAIIAYPRWKLATALSKDNKGVLTEQEFEAEILRAMRQIKRRPDLTSHWTYGMRYE